MELVLTAAVTILLAVIFSLLKKRGLFDRLPEWAEQTVIGVLFGVSACLATEFGTVIDGAVCNVRDAAPLTAGLVFGGPAGVIAGIIGGVYRLFWGVPFSQVFTPEWIALLPSPDVTGGFTRAACTVGTLVAGLSGALVREFLSERKCPAPWGGFAAGFAVEVFHMILVFAFRANWMPRGYEILRVVLLPMVLGNALTVMLSVMASQWINGEQIFTFRKKRDLTTAFRRGLLLCVVIAFSIKAYGVYAMQFRLGLRQTVSSLTENLEDLNRKIDADGGIDAFVANNFTWHVGSTGGIIICKVLPGENGAPDRMEVVLNGEEYSKGSLIPLDRMSGERISKTPENFFRTFLPIAGEEVEIYGMYQYIGGYVMISYVPIREATLYQGVTGLLTVCFDSLLFTAIFVEAFFLVKHLVLKNIHKINMKLSEITRGNLDTVVDVRTHNEFEVLSADINETVARLKHYIKEAEERIDKELEFARDIQLSALPSVFPPYPHRTDLDIFASMDTAKEVGGDFYDFYFTAQDKLAFLIADVSGKGIPASLFMMTAKTLLKGYAENDLPVNEVLIAANEKLCENNDAGMFVTCFMCKVDLKTGKLSFANAGHNPPLLYRQGQGFSFLRPRPGFVLAGMEGIKYKLQEADLLPGDCIFLYTDGVTEAVNEQNELFGDDRLLEVLNARPYESMEDLCRAVKSGVDAFAGTAPQFDDITMVAFRYTGTPEASISFPAATLQDIPVVTEFIESELEKIGCGMKTIYRINIAIDEICSNIIRYAYPKGPGPMTVKLIERQNPHRICIRFEDEGIPYNPLVKEDPDVTLSAEDRQIGGLGIFMVKQMVDDMLYKYEKDHNILTLVENLED